MFRPWNPIKRPLRPHPDLSWKIEGTSVTIDWEEWRNQICEFSMRIHFSHGLVGHIATDESIHFVAPYFPAQDNLINDTGLNLPWPAWISDKNYRLPLYTEYAATIYKSVVSYYFHGSETVLLLDIDNSDPEIEITPKPNRPMPHR